MMRKMAPRIYGIPATDAPVVVVFRRGPSNWSSVGRWDRDARLLVATRIGRLQIWRVEGGGFNIDFDVDLSPLEPGCRPAPDWAQRR